MTKSEIITGLFKTTNHQEFSKAIDDIQQNIEAIQCDYDSADKCEILFFIRETWTALQYRVIH